MNRHRFLSLALGLSISGILGAPAAAQTPASLRSTLGRLQEQAEKALKKRDLKTYAALLATDFTYMDSLAGKSVRLTRTEHLGELGKQRADGRSLEMYPFFVDLSFKEDARVKFVEAIPRKIKSVQAQDKQGTVVFTASMTLRITGENAIEDLTFVHTDNNRWERTESGWKLRYVTVEGHLLRNGKRDDALLQEIFPPNREKDAAAKS